MSTTVQYDPSTTDYAWRLLLHTYPEVARITVEQDGYYVSEVLVYYYDSEAPFPLQALRRQSRLRQDVFELVFGPED